MLLLMKGISEKAFWFCPQARRLVIERDMLGPDALEGENFPSFVVPTLMAKKNIFFNNKSHWISFFQIASAYVEILSS